MYKFSLFITSFAVSMLLAASTVFAGSYFGFSMGETVYADAPAIIEKAGGRCNSKYGYKGYTDLPMIRISAYETFEKFGSLLDAWLYFTPANKLYEIHITWADPGQTFATVKDALDAKYGAPRRSGGGFEQRYQYSDGDVSIVLNRNTFGFGNQQKTSISYSDTSATAEVQKMKRRIESVIREKNAAKAAGDL